MKFCQFHRVDPERTRERQALRCGDCLRTFFSRHPSSTLCNECGEKLPARCRMCREVIPSEDDEVASSAVERRTVSSVSNTLAASDYNPLSPSSFGGLSSLGLGGGVVDLSGVMQQQQQQRHPINGFQVQLPQAARKVNSEEEWTREVWRLTEEQEELQQIIIIRHGERADDADSKWHHRGRPDRFDPPLTPAGITQARKTGLHLKKVCKPDVILASPCWRTVQTAHEIALACGRPVCVEPGICEWLHKDWFPTPPKWHRADTLARHFDTIHEGYSPMASPPIRFENTMEVVQRVGNVLREVRERYKGKVVAIVTHGFVPQVAHDMWCGRGGSLPVAPYCSLTHFTFDDLKKPTVERLCDASHYNFA